MSKIRPLNDRIFVKRLDAEAVSAGGIIIPENAKEKSLQGQVVAVGNGKLLESGQREPVGCAPGDTVLFGKYQGSEIDVDGETLLVVRADEILGVIERSE